MFPVGWNSYRRLALALGMPIVAAILVWAVIRGPHDEFATLRGHTDAVFSLALAPDGKVVASGGGDGVVRLWKLADRREQAALHGHIGKVYAVAWSPDGQTIASGGEDKTIRLWNAATGEELQTLATVPKSVNALAFSSDGSTIAAAVELKVFFWKLDGRRDTRILSGHRRSISGMAFLPGRNELVTFAGDQTVRIWDLETGQQLTTMPGPIGHCYGLTISPDGKTIACVGGARVHLYDIETRKPLEPIEPMARIICGVAFSPDGKTLAIGSQDKEIVVWDLQQKKQRGRLNGHNYAVGQMAFLPDGETLVTSSHDSSLKLWKVK